MTLERSQHNRAYTQHNNSEKKQGKNERAEAREKTKKATGNRNDNKLALPFPLKTVVSTR